MKEEPIMLLPMESSLSSGEYIDPEDGLIHCSRCGDAKQMILGNSCGISKIVRVTCTCEQEMRKQEEQMQKEQERCARIEILRSKGIPDKLYRNYTFDSDPGLIPEISIAKSYADRFEQMEGSGTGLIFWGGIGTGKTYLAACIANALIDREIPVHMTSISRITNAMTGLFSEDRNRYLDSLNDCRLLVIDDLGVERNTEYSLEQIYSVIDSRYRSGRPMLLTTNLPLNRLEHPQDLEHARIYSRILERCVPVSINGADLRQQNAEYRFHEVRNFLVPKNAEISTTEELNGGKLVLNDAG